MATCGHVSMYLIPADKPGALPCERDLGHENLEDNGSQLADNPTRHAVYNEKLGRWALSWTQ